MKVSYLLESMGKTGGFIVLYNFMDQLSKRGYDVKGVFPDQVIDWEPGIWKELILPSKPSSVRNLSKSVYNSVFTPSLKDKYKNLKIANIANSLVNNWQKSDITVCSSCYTTYAGAALADKTVPYYHMQHYEEVFFKRNFDRLLARYSYSLPFIQISNSLWLKNILHKHFGKSSYVLNPGIDLETFKSNGNPEEKYFSDKKEWLIVSFFDEEREWKGFYDAVKVVKNLRESLIDSVKITWKVFGLKPPTRSYETDFDYVGAIFGPDLSNLYSSADIVLLTSWYESFPLPPIEAMASGTVVLTTRYGTEDYVFDGKNGFVTLPRDIEGLTEKLRYIIANPENNKNIVRQGVETAEKFTWEKRTDALEEIFHTSKDSYSFTKFKLFDDLVSGQFHPYMHEEFKMDN